MTQHPASPDLQAALAQMQNRADNLDLYGAQLAGANFLGARGVPIVSSSTVYSNTTCPDGFEVLGPPQTCVGHWLP